MVSKNIRPDAIVSFLQSFSEIRTAVSGNIFVGLPVVPPSWIYIVVMPVAQNSYVVEKSALVDVRVMGKATQVELINIIWKVSDALLSEHNLTYNIWWFDVYKVVDWPTFTILSWEDRTNILIKDFVFYFVK